jgi:preprotein translocase subunit SecE
MNISTIVWIVAVAALVIYLWRFGHLMRLSLYVQETREELRKCNWPTWNELKGSTVVVFVSIAILGVFTMATDGVFMFLMNLVYRTS